MRPKKSLGRRSKRVHKLGAGAANPAAEPVAFLIVFDDTGRRCIGHLFLRGPAGVEGLDRDDRSLGYFPDLASAAAAVTEAARCA
jgi:hypothetical protein